MSLTPTVKKPITAKTPEEYRALVGKPFQEREDGLLKEIYAVRIVTHVKHTKDGPSTERCYLEYFSTRAFGECGGSTGSCSYLSRDYLEIVSPGEDELMECLREGRQQAIEEMGDTEHPDIPRNCSGISPYPIGSGQQAAWLTGHFHAYIERRSEFRANQPEEPDYCCECGHELDPDEE